MTQARGTRARSGINDVRVVHSVALRTGELDAVVAALGTRFSVRVMPLPPRASPDLGSPCAACVAPLVDPAEAQAALATLIRADPTTPVVLALRSHAEQARVHLLERGADECVALEPETPEGIVSAVERAIGRERGRAEQRALHERRRHTTSLARLATGIAHDFNNALTVIVNTLPYVRRRVSDPRASADLELIERAAHTAGALARSLLDFGRARREDGKRVPVDEVVSHTVAVVGRALGELVSVESDLGAGNATTRIPIADLQEMLSELLTRARDAGEQAGERAGHITITTRRVDGSELPRPERAGLPYIRLAIADEGHGTPQASQERAADPRARETPADGEPEAGLAALARDLRQYGGQLLRPPAPSAGMRVTIYLPEHPPPATEGGGLPEQATEHATEHATDRARPPEVAAPPAPPEQLDVLIVEDEPAIAELIRRVLAEAGHRCVTAGGFREAEQMAIEPAPALVICDINLPDGPGETLLDVLSARYPCAQLIALSGDGAHLETLSPHQADATLGKPFDPDRLRAVLEAARPAAATRRRRPDRASS